jgi:hypothetical protein
VGIETLTDDAASVLVAAAVEVTRADDEPAQRTFRMRLELARVDGAWRTAALSVV